MSAKCPRWFVPSCSSNPSVVVWRFGTAITPALLINRSTGRPSPSIDAANASIEARLARSSALTLTVESGAVAADVVGRSLSLVDGADGEHDVGAGERETARGLEADAAVRAGDDGELAGLGGDFDLRSLVAGSCTVQL